MRFVETELHGVWLIDAEPFEDERGVFRRHFCAREFGAHGLTPSVKQGNISENPHEGTLRGFHYQIPPFGEAKTLSCLTGSIYDVIVDLRHDSPTFLQWVSTEISAANRRSLHVPAGCANAWLTTTQNTAVHYYMSEEFNAGAGRGIRFDDPALGVHWPRTPRVISDKDSNYPPFDRASVLPR